MNLAIIYCTSCLSVTALEEKSVPTPEAHRRALGCSREGSKTMGETRQHLSAQGKSYKGCQVPNAVPACQGPGGKI